MSSILLKVRSIALCDEPDLVIRAKVILAQARVLLNSPACLSVANWKPTRTRWIPSVLLEVHEIVSSAENHPGPVDALQFLAFWDTIDSRIKPGTEELERFPDVPWDPNVTCQKITNILLTAELMEGRMKEALSKTFQSILEVEIELEWVMTEQPEGEDCPKPPFHWVPEDVFLEYVLDLPIVVLMNKYAQVWLDIHKTAKTRHDWVRLVREWKHNRLPVPGIEHFADIDMEGANVDLEESDCETELGCDPADQQSTLPTPTLEDFRNAWVFPMHGGRNAHSGPDLSTSDYGRQVRQAYSQVLDDQMEAMLALVKDSLKRRM